MRYRVHSLDIYDASRNRSTTPDRPLRVSLRGRSLAGMLRGGVTCTA